MSEEAARGILVTGASKGIGRATAELLAERGFRVFAGHRSAEDGEALAAAGERVRPVRLDVTSAEEVEEARRRLEEEAPDGLAGVVNNAGMVVVGPLEVLPLDALRRQLEVNLVGVMAVAQAFLPALRRGGGRLIQVSSVNGRLAMPWVGAYCASKFALEAASDALRMELRRWDLPVVLVEPGAVETPIWESSLERAKRLVEGLPEEARELYGGMLRRLASREASAPRHAVPAERVARTIHRALIARRPRRRYLVGLDARLGVLAARLLPAALRDRLLG